MLWHQLTPSWLWQARLQLTKCEALHRGNSALAYISKAKISSRWALGFIETQLNRQQNHVAFQTFKCYGEGLQGNWCSAPLHQTILTLRRCQAKYTNEIRSKVFDPFSNAELQTPNSIGITIDVQYGPQKFCFITKLVGYWLLPTGSCKRNPVYPQSGTVTTMVFFSSKDFFFSLDFRSFSKENNRFWH